jgi:hypothetical protein
MLEGDTGHEDNRHERTPRFLRVLVFFSKYPELLAILLVVILALAGLMLTVFVQ